MVRRVELAVNEAPSSVNAGGGGSRRHWAIANREKKRWEGMWLVQMLASRIPRGMVQCTANAEIVFRRKARRDSTNWLSPLIKPLADVLAPPASLYPKQLQVPGQPRVAVVNHAPRWLPDDTDEYFRFVGLVLRVAPDELPPLVKARTTVYLEATYV